MRWLHPTDARLIGTDAARPTTMITVDQVWATESRIPPLLPVRSLRVTPLTRQALSVLRPDGYSRA
jgi:hypothetical protein